MDAETWAAELHRDPENPPPCISKSQDTQIVGPQPLPFFAPAKKSLAQNIDNSQNRVGMNGDAFSIKAPKECSKKFAATFQGKFLTRGNVLKIVFLFFADFVAPL